MSHTTSEAFPSQYKKYLCDISRVDKTCVFLGNGFSLCKPLEGKKQKDCLGEILRDGTVVVQIQENGELDFIDITDSQRNDLIEVVKELLKRKQQLER